MRKMTMAISNNLTGPTNPALITMNWAEVGNNLWQAARMLCFVNSIWASNMGTGRVMWIQQRLSGIPGSFEELPFPTLEYSQIRAWAMPNPLPAGMVQPPLQTGYGSVINGLGDTPLGTSALIVEKTAAFNELNQPVSPGRNGRLFLPYISSSAVQSGVLSTNAVAAIQKAYEWYILSAGDPSPVVNPPDLARQPYVHGLQTQTIPPAKIYRRVESVSVRQVLSHLRSRVR